MCPWIPADFFRDFLRIWSQSSGLDWDLRVDLTRSGPTRANYQAGDDPFTVGQAQAGILCAPTYLWGVENSPPRLCLAGWTPVFSDIQAPLYHSVVLVKKESPFQNLQDLRDAKWAFNDPCSLSGYFSVTTSLGGDTTELEARATFTGGHMESLAALMADDCHACAVDSNGWQIHRGRNKDWGAKLREVCHLGPFPTQPLVLSAMLQAEQIVHLRKSLESCVTDSLLWAPLKEEYGLVRFVKYQESDLKSLEERLDSSGPCSNS